MAAACPKAHYAEDMAYLDNVNMRGLLKEFLTDAMNNQPKNVYAYLEEWALQRKAATGAAGGKEEPTRKAPLMPRTEAAAARSQSMGEEL